jgi:hypothetical protein
VGVSYERGPSALADFWRDRTGKLVVRFSSQGYIFHLEAALTSGKPIPEDKLNDFGEYVSNILLEWLVEGVDELPDSIYKD